MSETIKEIFKSHKGKASDKWSLFLNEWDRLFSPYRKSKIRLLEIGIQNGGSLEIYDKYFTNAVNIIGCDIDQKCKMLKFDDERISVVVGDANSDEIEKEIFQYTPNLDIIIDDGSHKSSDIIKSFNRYFHYLCEDGIYVIEDLFCSYWAYHYEGGLYNPLSAMSFFKRLTDVLNQEHWANIKSRVMFLDNFASEFGIQFDENELSKIHSIEFMDTLCIIKKSHPEKNILGNRVTTGLEENVYKGILDKDGSTIQDIVQDMIKNTGADIYDDRNNDIFELISENNSLKHGIAERDQTLQSREQDINVLKNQLSEIEGSKKWKLALLIARIRKILAPEGSFQFFLLKKLYNLSGSFLKGKD